MSGVSLVVTSRVERGDRVRVVSGWLASPRTEGRDPEMTAIGISIRLPHALAESLPPGDVALPVYDDATAAELLLLGGSGSEEFGAAVAAAVASIVRADGPLVRAWRSRT